MDISASRKLADQANAALNDERASDSGLPDTGSAGEASMALPFGENRRLPLVPNEGLALSLERRRLQMYALLVLADVTILLGSFAIAVTAYPAASFANDGMLAGYLLLPLFQTIAFYNSTYSRGGLTNWRKASGRAVMALLISALLINFLAFFAKSNAEFSRVVFTSGLVASALGMTFLRFLTARWINRRWGPGVTNTLVIQAGGPETNIPNIIRVDAKKHGLEPTIDDPAALDRLAKYLRNMDQVIVSCRSEERKAWSEVLKGSGLHGEVVSEYAHEIGALGIVRRDEADLSTLLVSSGQLGIRARLTKRLFDVAVSLLALVLLSPLMLILALAIKLEDGGPVFFRQRRMGRGNHFFDIYKFRSMRVAAADASGTISASRDDDRITRVGRLMRMTSCDELPQLFDVLIGSMSIVGPRPHALGSLAGKKMFWQVDSKYWQRHSLRPGITGLAQIRGFRGATDTERDLSDRLQSDLEYLNNWSLWGDVKIVFATIRVLVHHKAF